MAGNFFEDLVFKVIADTKSAQEGLQKINGELQQLNKHSKSASSGIEAFGTKMVGVAKVGVAAIAAIGAALGVVAVKAVQAAAENEASIRKLEITLKNVTGASDQATKATLQFIDQLSLASGVADNTLRPALDQLVRSTKNTADAQKLLSLSLDVSAGTGQDLLSVSTALGSAYNGNFSQLQRLKTGISEATIQSQDFSKATGELGNIFAGQASVQANTFTGQMNRIKVAMSQVQQNLGAALTPLFQYLANVLIQLVIPAIKKLVEYLQAHPELIQKIILAVATWFNYLKSLAKGVLIVVDGLVQMLWVVTRLVQGIGFITGNNTFKDWGRNTSESLEGVNKNLNTMIDTLDKIDFRKYAQGVDFKIKLPDVGSVVGKGAGTGLGAAIQSDFNDAAKGILESIKKLKFSVQDVLKVDIKSSIKDLNLDPLTKSMRDIKSATEDYKKTLSSLTDLTKKSAEADLAYVKSLKDVSDAGKANSDALKRAADLAKDNAIQAANTTQETLSKIADAQRSYIEETVNRVKSLRSAFESATSFSLGSAVQNIQTAKQNLADAEAALKSAEDKFKTNIPAQAYQGVIINTAIPLFDAERRAVDKAKQDLAVALGKQKNPFTATVEELQQVLNNQYSNAVELSKVAGELAGKGYSQDLIEQIISMGADLGSQLGKALLSSSFVAQDNFKDIFSKLKNVSKNGVNDLSISLNQGAIDAMDSFIEGLKSISDPLDILMKSIENRINTMVKTIGEAIAAIMKQLQDLAESKVSTPTGAVYTPPAVYDPLSGLVTSSGAGVSQPQRGRATSTVANPQTSLQDWASQRQMERITINQTVLTNQDHDSVIRDTAWAIKTSSDVVYNKPTNTLVDYAQRAGERVSSSARTSVTSGGSTRGN